MAHIDHEFTVARDPAATQDLFLSEIGPELARDGSFHLVKQQPGALVFRDDLVTAPGGAESVMGSLGEGPQSAPGDEAGLSDGGGAADQFYGENYVGAPRRGLLDTELDQAFARHLHVQFTAADGGTELRIRGHARKALRDALGRMGTPGHWPENADQPHD